MVERDKFGGSLQSAAKLGNQRKSNGPRCWSDVVHIVIKSRHSSIHYPAAYPYLIYDLPWVREELRVSLSSQTHIPIPRRVGLQMVLG